MKASYGGGEGGEGVVEGGGVVELLELRVGNDGLVVVDGIGRVEEDDEGEGEGEDEDEEEVAEPCCGGCFPSPFFTRLPFAANAGICADVGASSVDVNITKRHKGVNCTRQKKKTLKIKRNLCDHEPMICGDGSSIQYEREEGTVPGGRRNLSLLDP
jgi:hypothetical protein